MVIKRVPIARGSNIHEVATSLEPHRLRQQPRESYSTHTRHFDYLFVCRYDMQIFQPMPDWQQFDLDARINFASQCEPKYWFKYACVQDTLMALPARFIPAINRSMGYQFPRSHSSRCCFHRACVDRFAAVEAIQPLNYGLSDIEGSFGLTDSVDGSSFISERKGDLPELECRLRALPDVLEELGVERIGLMKINIEGGEYDLLQSMADRDLFGRVDSLQIQFHDFAEDAVRRREAIQDALSRTHECTWCYDFVWEYWKRSSPTS